jgi:hypothetical protein
LTPKEQYSEFLVFSFPSYPGMVVEEAGNLKTPMVEEK